MKILCNISMFNLHQQVLLVDGEEIKPVVISNLDNLGADIAMACSKYSTNEVTLTGNTKFASVIAEEICMVGATQYGMNNINVEVI